MIKPIPAGRKGLIHRSPGDERLGKILHPAIHMRRGSTGDHQLMKTKIRSHGFFAQLHIRLPGGAASFFHVAGFAGHHHIDPGGFPAARLWDNVIHRQGIFPVAAILAGKVISSQYIFFAEGYVFPRFTLDQIEHADHCGNLQRHRGGSNHIAIALYLFGSTAQHHHKSPLGATKLQRLVRIIEDQNFQ